MRELGTRPTVFLDRDGTINVKAPDGEYITDPSQLVLIPGAAEAVRRINDAGALAIVVSNQRGVALGRMSEDDLSAVNAELEHQLMGAGGAHIDAFFHCPHGHAACDCRKPGTGMLTRAIERFPEIDRERSVLIGDSASDVEAGRRFGLPTFRLGVNAADLAAATDQALAVLAGPPERSGGGGQSDQLPPRRRVTER